MEKENKNDLIHIRIEHSVKAEAEEILKKLGLNTSYAVSMFLNQVIMRKGLPFEVEIPDNEAEAESLARIIEATGGSGKVNERDRKIIHLYANGDIDYETAVFAIKRNFAK
ncbi:MAG: type II toxin-antitoxin system RelB/DinJ family antitoxin [Bacillota bacterium]|nr:type II toxin-antitoxin system RelB/DinJ family antitoxin [Bacillota bacterium]